MKRKKPARRRKQETFFVVDIESWNWDYSLGINTMDIIQVGQPYLDFRHLTIEGSLRRPSAIAGRKVDLTFVSRPDFHERAKRFQEKPIDLGSLTLRRTTMVLEGVLPLPEDVLPSILPMLLAERFKFVVLDALDYYQGKASIRHYSLSATWNPDDLPPENTELKAATPKPRPSLASRSR